MSLQIFAGRAKGLSLLIPKGVELRPTSVMLRRKFFDRYQDLSSYRFFDICAGTGSMGFEAYSRGCEDIFFNELNAKILNNLKSNIKNLTKICPEAQTHFHLDSTSCEKYLRAQSAQLTMSEESIVFIDPPYEQIALYEKSLNILKEIDYKGLVVIEADRQKSFDPSWLESFVEIEKIYKQGTSYMVVAFLL